MTDHFCPTHSETKLIYVLKGGAGYCVKCCQYVQAAGVAMPKLSKATNKARKSRKIVQKRGEAKVQ